MAGRRGHSGARDSAALSSQKQVLRSRADARFAQDDRLRLLS